MVVSGLRSHSELGLVAVAPVMTSRVAEYGATVTGDDQELADDTAMVFGTVEANV